MPSGYTADIAKGISFRKFAWQCARAFGPFVTMRDDPMDAPIPEKFEPSSYYLEAVATAKARIAEIEAMTEQQILTARDKEYDDAIKYCEESIREAVELRAKYEDMLAHARGFVPPSPDHEGFKQFMVSQIEQSMCNDCDTRYYEEKRARTVKKEPAVWHALALRDAYKDLTLSEQHLSEEINRVEARNKWIRELREALK